MRYSKILIIIGIYCLLGCSKALDYVVDYPGEQLVVIGTVSPVSGAAVYVTKSISPSGDYQLIDDLLIRDAEVAIYHRDTVLGFLRHAGDGLYKSTAEMTFRANESYWIEVQHDQLGTVSSEEVLIPAPIRDFRSSFRFTGELMPSNEPEAEVIFSLRDEPGENHYIIRIKPDLAGAGIFSWFEPFGLQNFESCEITPLQLADICFDGRTFEMGLLFGVSGEAYDASTKTFRPYNQVSVSVASVSSEYYQYLADKTSLETAYGILEPKPTFNNINGGLGVFMAFNERVRKFGF
jgi:hypothetical protein